MLTKQTYHTFSELDFSLGQLPGWLVPQRVYRTDTAGFQPRPPVRFVVHGQLGIRLSDAYAQNCGGLSGGLKSLVLTETGMKIGLRIWVWHTAFHVDESPENADHVLGI